MPYVYLHKRLDKNEIFYVGIGFSNENLKRAYRKDGRNSIWNKITNKSEYEVLIYKKNISIEEAFDIERSLIKSHKRIKDGGTLSNITFGGEGVCGFKKTPWNKGIKVSPEKIRKGFKMPKQFGEKISKIMKEKIAMTGHHMLDKRHTSSSIEKMRKAKIGKKQSDNQRLAIKKPRIKMKTGIFINDVLIKAYDSIKEASIDTGISSGVISLILRSKRSVPKKYSFQLKKL